MNRTGENVVRIEADALRRLADRIAGPMAQDFHAAFGGGADDKHIATVDADGVALAAIQGLNQKVEERAAALRVENAALRRELAELKQAVSALITKVNGRGK